jgi:hypothetical protein
MELLSRGGSHLFNEYVISFPDFFDVFCHENMEFNGTRIQIKGILKDIGYTYSGKQDIYGWHLNAHHSRYHQALATIVF